jgi:hypothetical protein
MKNYVVFRVDNNTHEEIYVGAPEEDCDMSDIFVTDHEQEALKFATAREGYDWATARKLDWWKVGAR